MLEIRYIEIMLTKANEISFHEMYLYDLCDNEFL